VVFDVQWADLTLADVERFLRAAEEEGLLWEAKGGDAPRSTAITKAVCGFANSEGGYLILGADQEAGGWSVTGLAFPGGEAASWVSSVVTTTLRPIPRVDVKAWRLENDRTLAVVEVNPVAAKPCITNRGAVYERTSGQTLPVSDPVSLARLFDHGAGAQARAEETARRASGITPEPTREPYEPGNCLARVALAPVGLPSELGSHLFNRRFATETFRQCLAPHLHVGHWGPTRPWYTTVTQDALLGHLVGHDAIWKARAAWDGSVSFAYTSTSAEVTTDDLVRILQGAWNAGVALLDALNATGPVYLCFVGTPRPATSYMVYRWADLAEPTEEGLASVRRELQRAQGRQEWED
jgi:hypothetical protein